MVHSIVQGIRNKKIAAPFGSQAAEAFRTLSKRLTSAKAQNTVLRFSELQLILELGLPWLKRNDGADDGVAADLFPTFAAFHLPIAIAAALCERNSNQLDAVSKYVEEIRTSIAVFNDPQESEDLWRADTSSCNLLCYGSEEEEEEEKAMEVLILTALNTDTKAISSLLQFESAESLLNHLQTTSVHGVSGGQQQLLGQLVVNGPLHKKYKSSYPRQQQHEQQKLLINESVGEYLFDVLQKIKCLILPGSDVFNSCSHIQRVVCINTVNSLQANRDVDAFFAPAHIDALSPPAERNLANLERAVDNLLEAPNSNMDQYNMAQTAEFKQLLGIGPYSQTVTFSCLSSLVKFREFQLGRAQELLDRARVGRDRIHGSTKTLVQAGLGKMKTTFRRAVESSLVEISQCKISKVAGTFLDAWLDQAILHFAYLTPAVKMKDDGHNAARDGQMMLYVSNFLDCVAEHNRWFEHVESDEDEDANDVTMIEKESWSNLSRRECCSFMKRSIK